MLPPSFPALTQSALTQDDMALLEVVAPPSVLHGLCPESAGAVVSRAQLAAALTLVLFARLVREVPEAQRYVEAASARGETITFDHGAVRTVLASSCGALPCGEASITRILRPLGYALNGLYPLERLGMTGRSYLHADAPQDIPQFFLSAPRAGLRPARPPWGSTKLGAARRFLESELHPERFSVRFQHAVHDVLATSRDPLGENAKQALDWLERDHAVPWTTACNLLPDLAACFARQHDLPSEEDYETLRAESAEMAWISTEGQTFNHATDRVADVEALAARLRAEGYSIKDRVEVSQSGRVRQTALRAALVRRALGGAAPREVPGSFFEFISRSARPGTSLPAGMDMGFDTSNATGIFKMTAR
ncbi:hypothetical protein GALL_278200 [mine drainage metagenome]|uniref:2-oxoadipate dioxygenase/decarboxylase n=1 Tax=mine drainage metagenome TaxID=410659 RepID=A0A1J5RLA1_9ZZZZ